MTNLFNSDNYPLKEPSQLVIGDFWRWKRTDISNDYNTDDYALKYSLRLSGDGTTEIEITAAETGGEYVIEEASATTAAYTAGIYFWQLYITRSSDSERITVDRGIVEVLSNQDAATADPRTHAKKMVDEFETAIEALNLGASSVSINGRTWTSRTLSELIEIYNFYLAKYKVEERKRNNTGGAKLKYIVK